ncbi:hypothetical protein BKA70DRAFT_1426598 [Coprinopsis sp. MPI-PUGE-AT-0042]|nr:hypothetical protein BKA70DRAFT_1426598 [Coprinopsis sp. MPI-PUGE-AT-0042]
MSALRHGDQSHGIRKSGSRGSHEDATETVRSDSRSSSIRRERRASVSSVTEAIRSDPEPSSSSRERSASVSSEARRDGPSAARKESTKTPSQKHVKFSGRREFQEYHTPDSDDEATHVILRDSSLHIDHGPFFMDLVIRDSTLYIVHDIRIDRLTLLAGCSALIFVTLFFFQIMSLMMPVQALAVPLPEAKVARGTGN